MPWFKVDDKLHAHMKVVEAGEAMALWVVAGSWCSDHLTDGFVPRAMAARLMPGGDVMAVRLAEVGLWDEATRDGRDGWVFRDWDSCNPTAAEVEAKRDISRRRWAMNNDPELRKIIRGRDGDGCRYCHKSVNWSDRRGPDGGTYDHVVPISQGGSDGPENLVVCCRECNSRKGGRTPDEAGMHLLDPLPQGSTQLPPKSDLDRSVPPVPVPVPTVPTEQEEPSSSDADAPDQQDDVWPDEVITTVKAVATLIAKNGHPLPNKGTKANRSWLLEMDRLLRLGPPGQTTVPPPTPDEVIDVATWACNDSFWAGNVQSIPKLRVLWSQLAIKARGSPGTAGPTGLDAVVAAARRTA